LSEKKKIILSVTITFLITFLLCFFLFGSSQALPTSKSEKVESLIKSNFIGEADENKIEEYKAKGAAAALGDEHSYYLTTDEHTALMSDITGEYKGIGVEIYSDSDGHLAVSNVFIDTPAYNAGIRVGDAIIKVDNIEITLESAADAINYMRGTSEEGKKVEEMTVSVLRNGEIFSAKLKREEIKTQTVFSEDINGIRHIRITSFSNETANEFLTAVENTDGVSGIVIDVRDNPGGLLNVVVKICDMILPECKIVYTQDKAGKQNIFNSDANSLNLPVAILINEYSASASEILAGAVKDNKAGTLIGTKSYGKGSVQEIFPFADSSALKLTVAYYYTPSGVCINGVGISPDYEVTIPEENLSQPLSTLPLEKDPQLQKALEVLSQK